MQNVPIIYITLASLALSGCVSMHTKQGNNSTAVTPFSAQGWGGTTCQQLIYDITPGNVGFQQAVQNIRMYQSWTSGFISGVNYEDNIAYDVSGGTSPEETFVWLKEFCHNNADTPVPVALHERILTWKEQGKTRLKAQ